MQLKKYRKQEQCFVVEGARSVAEVMRSHFEVVRLVTTQNFLDTHRKLTNGYKGEVIVTTPEELQRLGDFNTNDAALAVVRMRAPREPDLKPDQFCLVLDEVRDPGNLGTIIRIADWYGIKDIIASPGTADVYNSKVIAASMGSFTRVNVYYTDLVKYLTGVRLDVIGTFLSGENIHQADHISGGLVVIGNEASGISNEVAACVTRRITIPRYGHAESLNAAVAAAVVCDNLLRLKGCMFTD